MHHDRALVDALLRNNFPSFVQRCFQTLNPGVNFDPNWHHDAIDFQLNRVSRGELRRLIINMPPRHLKSLIVSIAFPAFLLGHEPWRRIFVISYGAELADRHAADFRSIVESDWYKRVFSTMRIKRIHENEVTTTARGFRKSTTVMGSLTGLGGDLFIIDDPQKTQDAMSETRRNSLNQWVPNTLMSRLDNKQTGVVIIVMQRVHINDVCGFLTENSSDWEALSLPAIAESEERIQVGAGTYHLRKPGEALHPAREPLEILEEIRGTVGSDVFFAQYLQSPVPPGGNTIKRGWLRYYDDLPPRTHRGRIILSWDTAAKDGAQNDWSVCTAWLVQDKHFYLLDLIRDRYEYPRLREVACNLAERFKPHTVLIEDASTGIALAQELRRLVRFRIKPVPIERDKIGRLYVQQLKFESGLVWFARSEIPTGVGIGTTAIPAGKNG